MCRWTQSHRAVTPAIVTGLIIPTRIRSGAIGHDVRTVSATLQLAASEDADDMFLVVDEIAPLSSLGHRIITVLTGLWIAYGAPGCSPDRGHHEPTCWHARNMVPAPLSFLTRAVYGSDGGVQRRQLRRGLAEAGRYLRRFQVWNTVTRKYVREVSHLISVREAGTVRLSESWEDVDADVVVAFDGFIHQKLMAGHFTYVPMALVQGLSRSAYLLWQQTLAQPKTATARAVGDVRRYTVGGDGSAIPLERLGLDKMRREHGVATVVDRLRADANAGNALVTEHRLGVVAPARRGGALVMEYTRMAKPGTDRRYVALGSDRGRDVHVEVAVSDHVELAVSDCKSRGFGMYKSRSTDVEVAASRARPKTVKTYLDGGDAAHPHVDDPLTEMSGRQRSVLRGIRAEHADHGDPDWLDEVLRDVGDSDDPYRAAMDAHRAWKRGRPVGADDEDFVPSVPRHDGQHPDCIPCGTADHTTPPPRWGLIHDPVTGQFRRRTPGDPE